MNRDDLKKANILDSDFYLADLFVDDKGRMNAKSTDERYTELIGNLRSALKTLAKKIEPKVYQYGFLKE